MIDSEPATQDRHLRNFDKFPLPFISVSFILPLSLPSFSSIFFLCLNIYVHVFSSSTIVLYTRSFFPFSLSLDRRIATLMTTRRDAIGAIGAIMILFIDCNLLGCAFLACLIHRCELYLDRNDRAIGRCG